MFRIELKIPQHVKKQKNVTHSQEKRKSMEAKPGKTQMLKSATFHFKAVVISVLKNEKEICSQ